MYIPEEIRLLIWNYITEMNMYERRMNAPWHRLHAEYAHTLWSHAEPYCTLTPELFGWGLALRHGPYKYWLIQERFITEERCPLDL